MMKQAKESITIISPYFLTGTSMRRRLITAVKSGLKVTLLIPKHSDVHAADYLRDIFLGKLSRRGVDIQLFTQSNLHAKMLLIDRDVFAMGSTNFDYRSFRYMYEINLSGKQWDIVSLIEQYIKDTLTDCKPFNYELWQTRPLSKKIIGYLLYPIRRLI
jgi:cardiolipin synthase